MYIYGSIPYGLTYLYGYIYVVKNYGNWFTQIMFIDVFRHCYYFTNYCIVFFIHLFTKIVQINLNFWIS